MARVSIVNRAKLSARLSRLLLRAGLRSVGGRVNGYRPLTWPVPPHKNDRLLIAPQDLRTADATRASEVYSGRFAFAGKVVICDGRSVFEMTPPSDDWATELLSFGWLRHLRAANPALPAPTPARWSTNGSACRAPGIPSAGTPTCWRSGSFPG